MPNGAAVALPLEPVSIPIEATADKPVFANSQEIAEAVASATAAFCYALLERQEGELRSTTRTAIGERVGKVAMMQLDHEAGDDNFAIHARGARPILRQSFDADYLRRYTSEQVDRTLDFFLDELLGVVARVVTSERTFRTN